MGGGIASGESKSNPRRRAFLVRVRRAHRFGAQRLGLGYRLAVYGVPLPRSGGVVRGYALLEVTLSGQRWSVLKGGRATALRENRSGFYFAGDYFTLVRRARGGALDPPEFVSLPAPR